MLRVRTCCLQHSGHTLLPSSLMPMTKPMRKLTFSDQHNIWELHDSQLTRQQIVQLLSDKGNRYFHPKDVSNTLSHKKRQLYEGRNQTQSLLLAATSKPGWEVKLAFRNCAPAGMNSFVEERVPCAFLLYHASMMDNFRKWHDILIIDETYSVNQ